MPALLNTQPKFVNPKSNIIYGSGNKKISKDEIKAFLNSPGRTDAEIEGAALKYGVSRDQIIDAGAGNARFSQSNVDRYLNEQGITKELNQPLLKEVSAPNPIKASPVTVGKNETVEGRMSGILKDPNNPLNVQAQTFGNQQANRRGLLNSSIAVSSAQDAMYKNALPIAQQDAATFYDANKTNSAQDLQAGMFNNEMTSRVGMFNSDLGARVDMFNTGVNKDIMLNRENNDLNREIAKMDSDNKLAIANIQAMASDSGIMGDLGKSYMSLYQQTASDPNIAPEVKTQIFNQLKAQFEGISTLLPSFERSGKKLTFGSNPGDGDSVAAGGTDTGKKIDTASSRTDGTVASPGWDGNIGSVGTVEPNKSGKGYTAYLYGTLKNPAPVPIDTSDYKLTGAEKTGLQRYNRDHGLVIDTEDVIPQAFVDELQRMGQMGLNYDVNWFGSPIQPPGTMRTDMPSYYIWKAALPKYQ